MRWKTRSNQGTHSYWLLKLGIIMISKHYQSTTGWALSPKWKLYVITQGDQNSASECQPDFSFKISTKLHLQNLDETLASKFSFKKLTKPKPQYLHKNSASMQCLKELESRILDQASVSKSSALIWTHQHCHSKDYWLILTNHAHQPESNKSNPQSASQLVSHSLTGRPDICHKYHELHSWRKNCHNCGEISAQLIGFYCNSCRFVAKSVIHAVLSRNLFCHNLRAFMWRKIEPKNTFVEKKWQISTNKGWK